MNDNWNWKCLDFLQKNDADADANSDANADSDADCTDMMYNIVSI